MRTSIGSQLHSSGGSVDPPGRLLPLPPQWVADALGVDARLSEPGANVQAVESGPLLLLTTSVSGASAMPAHALRARVAEAYVAIGDTLSHFDRHPIRFWNFLPDPGAIMDGGLDRYMIFNAGRFDGYMRWPGRSSERGPSLPAASAVGSVGDDVVVHCLASDEVGTPIENPRQKPAWQYSPRYGPVPPCFSRATIATVGGERVLLIGGTASIVGEDSRHGEDAGEQLAETLKNLEALIDASCGAPQKETSLSRLIDLRTYVAREQDAPAIRAVLAARCTRAARIELTIAQLCRGELLVEVEGVATLQSPCET